MATRLPKQFGRYRAIRVLGSGGMGVVYLAEDPQRALQVAVKLVRPELAADANYQERFRREIGMAFRVTGPHTARILAADLDADEPYFVTEYVDGPTLGEHVRENGPVVGSELRDLAVGIAAGLVSIHAVGLVHRDLKPANVLLSDNGPRLIDFGIAADPTASSLTRPGERIGTPGWLAPEQARGREVGPATDVFAWGALMAFAGTGREPFGRGPAEAALYRVVHEDPDLNGLDDSLRPLVAQTLNKSPAGRPTAEQLQRRLDANIGADTTQRAAPTDDAATSPLIDKGVGPKSLRRRYRGWIVTAAIALFIATAATVSAVALSQDGPSNPRSRTSPSAVATTSASTAATPPASTAPTPPPGPPTPSADEIASEMARTVEVDDSSTHFEPIGEPVTVPDGASGTLTAAIGRRSPSGDGTGQLIFFWHDTSFLGWHSNREITRLGGLSGVGPGHISAVVNVFGPNDPLCCPTLPPVAISYQWTGQKVVPSASLPQGAVAPFRVKRLP